MQMKAAIAALLQSAKDRNYGVPRETEVARAYAALTPPATDVVLSEPPDIDEITREMRRRLRSGSDLSPAELRDAPVCLWAGSHPLDSVDDAAADVYFDLLRSVGNRGMFRRLAAVYVVRYPVRFPRFKKASEILSELAGRFPGPWSNAQKSLWIFTPERGPDLIASAALHKRVPPMQTLADHGLRVPLGAGLTEAAFVEGLRKIATSPMGVAERLEVVQTWLKDRPGRPEHDENRGAIADALLLAYEGGFPDKRDRDKLLSFLLERYGDPRVRPANWRPMPKALSIAKKWLIEQSLRQFLDVVSEAVKYDVIKSRQWSYRRAFWTAVYRHQLISDACVVFDRRCAGIARNVFEGETPYARWRGGQNWGAKQIQQGQACLLLRIGPGVVAEWSHNGKCNIWKDAADPKAPKLHKDEYSSSEVEANSESGIPIESRVAFVHGGAANYTWQGKVADVINTITSVRIPPDRYSVK
jgi:hypothetical protein